MPNFFVNKAQIKDSEIHIFGDDAHHIARSLRMAEGDTVTVCDGEGAQYQAKLVKIRDEECVGIIESSRDCFGESPVSITLFMGYPKSDKLEIVVQKATELGASRVIPFESSRCIKRPNAERAKKITERLSKIAKEAAKQCSRSKIPEISEPIDFCELVRLVPNYGVTLFCYEGASVESSIKNVLSEIPKNVETVAVIVGSEGGFSEEEATELTSAGAVAVSLGERILRCETAPDFILSLLSYKFEL